jgi:hypothetical protein
MQTITKADDKCRQPEMGGAKLKMLQHFKRISAKPVSHLAPLSIDEVGFNWAVLFIQQNTFTHFRAASDGFPEIKSARGSFGNSTQSAADWGDCGAAWTTNNRAGRSRL